MKGLSDKTGQVIDGDDYLRGAIARILFTPIGSRVMRRGFGSLLFELIDQPMNAALPLRLFAATALALLRSDPKLPFRLTRVGLQGEWPGKSTLALEGVRTDRPRANSFVRLTVPLRWGAPAALPHLATPA